MNVALLAGEQSARTDWVSIIIASAAVLGALAAIVAVILEGRRVRRQMEIENLWRLIERWDGPAGRAHRAEAANQLLAHSVQELGDVPFVVIDLLDTLELLGYLVRSRTLGLDDVWTNFPGAIQWWHVCRPIIEQWQADDPTLYEDFARLARRLLEIETERRGTTAGQTPSEDELERFLQGERDQAGTSPPS